MKSRTKSLEPTAAGTQIREPSAAGLSRRELLRLSTTMAAATAMTTAACKMPQEEVLPFVERPEDANTLGKARHYATVLDGLPVLARTRESRPILITKNPNHISRRGLTVRSQAALLDLYDPDRAQGPLSVRRSQGAPVATSWKVVSAALLARLAERKGEAVLLTPPLSGPATLAAISELSQAAGITHLSYDPLESDAVLTAYKAAFGGVDPPPRPRLDRASLIVGFGAELCDQPADGLERELGLRRAPEGEAPMSRLIQLEGRLTLTGANADRRIRVRDSQLPAVAAAVAHQLVIGHKLGPLGDDAAVVAALGPFTPAAVAKTSGVPQATIEQLAAELQAARGKALAIGGGSPSAGLGGVALELCLLVINHSLGAYGAGGGGGGDAQSPLFEGSLAVPAAGGLEALQKLTERMLAGKVDTLIIAGVNPVYDAPEGIDFAKALGQVGLVVSLNDRLDETSAHADWLAPQSHPLEAWGDADLGSGLLGIQQPVLRPLHTTYGLLDILVTWGAGAGVKGEVAAAVARSKSDPARGAVAELSAAYHYLRAYWGRQHLGQKPDTPEHEQAWSAVLRQGYWQGPQPEAPAVRTFSAQALSILGAPQPPVPLELQLYPHFALHDGRSANNGWLLELADPITRITWDGAASIAPRRFDEMELSNGDLVEISVGNAVLELPAYRHAGMHYDQIAVALGQGRTKAGLVGSGIGQNAFKLQQLKGGRAVRAGLPAGLRRARGHKPLAIMQGSEILDRDRRPLVPVTTLKEYRQSPKAGTEQPKGGPSAWPEHKYEGNRWEMVIDLSKCNGCGKCTVACQAENNIPVVGPAQIRNGRQMCWIRIDRYYDAPKKEGRWGAEVHDGPLEVVEEPTTLFEPMLCQHCENAPCETVCPFNATMHSADGLNQQIYNRCVGTRYCANNCPFKVRRYNWFEYSFAQSSTLFRRLFPVIEANAIRNTRGQMALKNNPEVTVRSRGVMEKCSFCVQRIREARAEALRRGRKGKIPDGAVVPACMEACPTGAIVFGDSNDKSSRVHALQKSPRAMRLLELLGVKPAISYLTKVRNNDNA